MENKIKLFAVCGPTASGKTALSIALAKAFDGEVVSAFLSFIDKVGVKGFNNLMYPHLNEEEEQM